MSIDNAGAGTGAQTIPTLDDLCRGLNELVKFAILLRVQANDIDQYLKNGVIAPKGEKDQNPWSEAPLLRMQELIQATHHALHALDGNLGCIGGSLGVPDMSQPPSYDAIPHQTSSASVGRSG